MDLQAMLPRPKGFKISAFRRQIAQTENMIAVFERLIAELDREVRAEEDRTGIDDPMHFAYSTLAKASSQRRDNLKRSVNQLGGQLDEANSAKEALENEQAAIWQESTNRHLSQPEKGLTQGEQQSDGRGSDTEPNCHVDPIGG